MSQEPTITKTKEPHEPITLKGYDGRELTIDSKEPYSPKHTCGECHEYDKVTSGYHFQQGRTDSSGQIVISDSFKPKKPWHKSKGMFGKRCPNSDDASQVAWKINESFSDIDKSVFYFVQKCGKCHPGGGSLEYDRDSHKYYNAETGKFGWEISGRNPRLDGDYTPFSNGDPNFGAAWDKSGLLEADCLMCHLPGYDWKARRDALNGRKFRCPDELAFLRLL